MALFKSQINILRLDIGSVMNIFGFLCVAMPKYNKIRDFAILVFRKLKYRTYGKDNFPRRFDRWQDLDRNYIESEKAPPLVGG